MDSPTGILINYRLDERKRSLAWLAEQLNVSYGMVSHIQSGRRMLSVELMARVSEVLDIPLADLEYAKAIQNGNCELSLDTMRRRACALAIMRVWRACTDHDLGRFQRLAELIHIEMMNER